MTLTDSTSLWNCAGRIISLSQFFDDGGGKCGPARRSKISHWCENW